MQETVCICKYWLRKSNWVRPRLIAYIGACSYNIQMLKVPVTMSQRSLMKTSTKNPQCNHLITDFLIILKVMVPTRFSFLFFFWSRKANWPLVCLTSGAPILSLPYFEGQLFLALSVWLTLLKGSFVVCFRPDFDCPRNCLACPRMLPLAFGSSHLEENVEDRLLSEGN